MIRHLTAVEYDSRQKHDDVGVVEWRQWKRNSKATSRGLVSHRSSAHVDIATKGLVYDERGERVRKAIPRYEKAKRKAVVTEGEKLRKLAVKVTGLKIVKVAYAPGSPNVDLYYREGDEDVHVISNEPSLHKAAHKFAEHVADELADPGQPVSIWRRRTSDLR